MPSTTHRIWLARAHGEIMADRMSGSSHPSGRSRRENNLVQTSASIPHASSKFWGTYLLSLCFCTHSLSGIELRYSFSDSFNPRTISSNEVGVTGMSPQALPQFELPLIRNLQHLINILIGRKTCTNKRRSLRGADSECSRSSDPDPPDFANLWSSKTKAPPTPFRVQRRPFEQLFPEVCSTESLRSDLPHGNGSCVHLAALLGYRGTASSSQSSRLKFAAFLLETPSSAVIAVRSGISLPVRPEIGLFSGVSPQR